MPCEPPFPLWGSKCSASLRDSKVSSNSGETMVVALMGNPPSAHGEGRDREEGWYVWGEITEAS